MSILNSTANETAVRAALAEEKRIVIENNRIAQSKWEEQLEADYRSREQMLLYGVNSPGRREWETPNSIRGAQDPRYTFQVPQELQVGEQGYEAFVIHQTVDEILAESPNESSEEEFPNLPNPDSSGRLETFVVEANHSIQVHSQVPKSRSTESGTQILSADNLLANNQALRTALFGTGRKDKESDYRVHHYGSDSFKQVKKSDGNWYITHTRPKNSSGDTPWIQVEPNIKMIMYDPAAAATAEKKTQVRKISEAPPPSILKVAQDLPSDIKSEYVKLFSASVASSKATRISSSSSPPSRYDIELGRDDDSDSFDDNDSPIIPEGSSTSPFSDENDPDDEPDVVSDLFAWLQAITKKRTRRGTNPEENAFAALADRISPADTQSNSFDLAFDKSSTFSQIYKGFKAYMVHRAKYPASKRVMLQMLPDDFMAEIQRKESGNTFKLWGFPSPFKIEDLRILSNKVYDTHDQDLKRMLDQKIWYLIFKSRAPRSTKEFVTTFGFMLYKWTEIDDRWRGFEYYDERITHEMLLKSNTLSYFEFANKIYDILLEITRDKLENRPKYNETVVSINKYKAEKETGSVLKSFIHNLPHKLGQAYYVNTKKYENKHMDKMPTFASFVLHIKETFLDFLYNSKKVVEYTTNCRTLKNKSKAKDDVHISPKATFPPPASSNTSVTKYPLARDLKRVQNDSYHRASIAYVQDEEQSMPEVVQDDEDDDQSEHSDEERGTGEDDNDSYTQYQNQINAIAEDKTKSQAPKPPLGCFAYLRGAICKHASNGGACPYGHGRTENANFLKKFLSELAQGPLKTELLEFLDRAQRTPAPAKPTNSVAWDQRSQKPKL